MDLFPTNAVVLAVLPHLSDYCGRLRLPILTPITTNHIREVRINSHKLDDIKCVITLTNGAYFGFKSGFVETYDCGHSLATLQSFDGYRSFAGKIKVPRSKAESDLRERILRLNRLGFEPLLKRRPDFDGPPPVDGTGGVVVPVYHFGWTSATNYVEVEYNADSGQIARFHHFGNVFHRPSPVIPGFDRDGNSNDGSMDSK